MKITELREKFRKWPDNFAASSVILRLLKDPTPITEAGLRELGFTWDDEDDGWSLDDWFAVWFCGIWRLHSDSIVIDPKTLGQLRGLLLFAGDA